MIGDQSHQIKGQLVAHTGQIPRVLVELQRLLSEPCRGILVELNTVGLLLCFTRAAATYAHFCIGTTDLVVVAGDLDLDLGFASIIPIFVKIDGTELDLPARIDCGVSGHTAASLICRQIRPRLGSICILILHVQSQQRRWQGGVTHRTAIFGIHRCIKRTRQIISPGHKRRYLRRALATGIRSTRIAAA